MVHYLGGRLDAINFVLGFLICILIYLMRLLLNLYYDHPDSSISTLVADAPVFLILRGIKRNQLLQYALLVLAAGAMFTAILISRKALSTAGLFFLGAALFVFFFCASPPVRFDKAGYGDLVEGIATVTLLPAFFVTIMRVEIPGLLVQLTLPLLLLFTSARIAFSFYDYGSRAMDTRNNLVTLLGWQRAVIVHNILIFGTFFLTGVFLLVRLPWSLAWPVFLALPVGIFQVWLMIQISEGAKPAWKVFLGTTLGLYMLVVYLVHVALWS